jgi:DNA modification methylase/superfamily II DNA or RNA helicase
VLQAVSDYVPPQIGGDCLANVGECRLNQRLYPDQKDLAIAGELDWMEEHLLSGGSVADLLDEGKYHRFLARKETISKPSGFECGALSPILFDFQRDIVRWALRQGRAAIFADCGLGKTFMQLEWARCVTERTDKQVLILAPLTVSSQTVQEGKKLGVEVQYCRTWGDAPIIVTNYEMLEHFSPDDFAGIVLDESSILKSFEGHFRNTIIQRFSQTPYRLACTATPAPNDHMELGNHSEFLGNLTRTEMLSTFFVHDGGDTSHWRLKGHAKSDFWKWVASWAVMLRNPSDLGYDGSQFILPPIDYIHSVVEGARDSCLPEHLFALPAQTLQERRAARAGSTNERVAEIVRIVSEKPNEQWLVWCNLNLESTAAARAIPDAVEVTGSDTREHKESTLLGFADGKVRVVVSKPSIAGWGMNFQNCANIAFLGLNDSFEQFYQAVRRVWRFGQKRSVNCYIVTSDLEGAVVENINRKAKAADEMAAAMVEHMHVINEQNIRRQTRTQEVYRVREERGEGFTVILGDSVEQMKRLANDSIHYSIFSPPFASLYTYSASDRDMGNCRTHAEFYEHFEFLIAELYRAMMSGRLLSFHCMNLPTLKERDGVIGITDFRGELIRMFSKAGFIYHSEVVIWKDPVTAMQRTKALGLLHKQLKKDSCMSRQGIPDYLVTMRKPGNNPERVTHTNESFPVQLWQRYASPVWMDINLGDTLQRESAREEQDERHICPLQLQVIERGIELWTNPNDLVCDPFMGIGSSGYVALKTGRRFWGCELKESYFVQAVANLHSVKQVTAPLFAQTETA